MVVVVSHVMALLSSALSGKKAAAEGDGDDDGGQCRCWRDGDGVGGGQAAAAGCCVCISGFRDGEEVRRLPCGHAFHRDCVDRWLLSCRRTCPLCRVYVVVDGNKPGVAAKHTGEPPLAEDMVIWFSAMLVPGF